LEYHLQESRDYPAVQLLVLLILNVTPKIVTMKKLKIFLFLLVATLGSWSCSKKTPILNATFESDSVNGDPAKDLVGAPSGDSIVYHDAIQPRLSVQEESTLSGTKALHFAKVILDTLPPDASQSLRFKGIGTDLTQTLRITLIGKNNGLDVVIDVSDGDGHKMAEIRITGDGQVIGGGLIGGDVGHDPHIIVFTMFPSSLKYNVAVTSASGTTTSENIPMITDNLLRFSNPAHPTLSFEHYWLTVFGQAAYVIGSVNISREEP
jgi:hypothetical protein